MRGHIRERSPGHWAIVIDVRDPATGNRKRRWHSFEGTKRQAQIECARLVSELQHGGAIEPSRITVGQFLDRFERDWLATHVTARSAERYAYALKHVRRHLGDRSLQKLQPADLAALYAELFRGGLASRTIKLIHRVLHRALGQAKVWGASATIRQSLPSHPGSRIGKPKCCNRIERPSCWSVSVAGRSTCWRALPWQLVCGATKCLPYAGKTSTSTLVG
jgi:hypothetical protein